MSLSPPLVPRVRTCTSLWVPCTLKFHCVWILRLQRTEGVDWFVSLPTPLPSLFWSSSVRNVYLRDVSFPDPGKTSDDVRIWLLSPSYFKKTHFSYFTSYLTWDDSPVSPFCDSLNHLDSTFLKDLLTETDVKITIKIKNRTGGGKRLFSVVSVENEEDMKKGEKDVTRLLFLKNSYLRNTV